MVAHLYELVRDRARLYPKAIALGSQQGLIWKTVDSIELLNLVDRLSEELAGRGIAAGDRVVLWLPSHWRTPVFLFALWKLGAIVVPFDREMNPEAGADIVASVEPRTILSGFGEHPTWAQGREVTEWWEPGSEIALATTAWSVPPEELAAAVFTSGTTGAPKGCMISHANLISQIQTLDDVVQLDPSCRLASVLPLSHMFELTCGLLYPLSRGAAVHYVPSRRGPDIARVLREQKVTHMMCVPQLLMMMGQALDDQMRSAVPKQVLGAMDATAARLPLAARRRVFWPVHRKLGGHLRLMVSGGAALPAETQLYWEKLGVRVVQGYGASECSPVIAAGKWDGSSPVGSVGRPLRGVEVRLSSEGELVVRGPNVMRGYWKDPARTAEVLHDGWYATGDLCRIDDGGNLWIQGRARDLIVLPSGLNLWPQDVEAVLCEHPAVKDAAVVAVVTPSGGATLHAYLIPHGPEMGISEIIASCNARLAPHQRVVTASWWPEVDFPRTSTLKVRRNLLPQPEAGVLVKVSSVAALDDPVGQAVAGVARITSVPSDRTLAELGLDSLGIVELVVALESKTGKSIGDDLVRGDMTVQQVRDALSEAPEAAEGEVASDESDGANHPLWPYQWGRMFRVLAFPADVIFHRAVSRTIVLGADNLRGIDIPVIIAGTHHGFPDMSLVRRGLLRSPAPKLASRIVPAAASVGITAGKVRISGIGLWPWYSILAFGIYPLRQQRHQEASLRRLVEIGQQGNAILIFPQGTHARPEDERAGDPSARFKSGVAHLATALDVPVVPFGLAGTELIVPPRVEDAQGLIIGGVPLSFEKGPLAIAFGTPLRRDADESAELFTARLQKVCFELTREAEAALTRG